MVADKNTGIRVTVRYRPLNTREKAQKNNAVCIKVSDCHRACQVHNATTDRSNTFFFDKVYPAGVSQADVYEYTGKPLVEACLKGFNSTLFAYGQTGSGKTFSMMGVLGTDLRGIQPRVIEDLFDYIDNREAGDKDEYDVQVSMCEIYMERIKDLLNPMETNLQVRESPDKGVYIENICYAPCASAQEVLDNMEQGFMNRATSATKMNPESSRSHCVTMLKVIKRSADGSVTESKIKMVDLAGSEKTSKTEATGQRLKEAMMINSSLTALSKVLKALCEGQKFIPYRDSKLTRLLSDALGGNSKTSLICAASPCAYNCEETISTLRFGTRAKQVKCNAKMNVNLSPDAYKKKCTELEKEVEVLTTENELLTAKQKELKKFLSAKNYSFDDIVKHVKLGGQEQLSAEGMSFEQVSDQVFEINKKSGLAVGGTQSFSISMNSKKSLLAKLEKERADNARIAQLVFACISKGDYEQVGHILEGRLTNVGRGSVSGARVSEYEDQIADLKAELRGAENQNDQVLEELDTVNDKMDEMFHEISALKAHVAEHRFYKQKVNFLEKENEMVMKQVRTQGSMLEGEEDVDTQDLDWARGCSPQVQAQIEKLAKSAGRNAALVHRMRGERGLNMKDIMEALQGNDKAAAVKKILQSQIASQTKLASKTKEVEKCKRAVIMLQTKEQHWRALQQNWKNQLTQMEQAVILCSTIQKRDNNKFKTELQNKDAQIEKLKSYVAKMNQIKQTQHASQSRPARFTVKKRAIQKKRRPARASPSPTRDAGAQVRA